MEEHQPNAGDDRVELLRRWILGVLVLGLLGTVVELVLLEHYERLLQLVPVVLIAIAIAVLVWHVIRKDTASRAALLVVMAFAMAGFVKQEHAGRAHVLALYWHFVDTVWIVVFTVVYLIGR